MNVKKTSSLLLLSLLLLLAVTACVPREDAAPTEGGLFEGIRNALNWLFVEPGKAAAAGQFDGADFVLRLRIMFSLLTFLILFGLSETIKDQIKFSRRLRVTIAIVLSLITTIFIPGEMLATAFAAYGIVMFGFILTILILAGSVFLWAMRGTNRGIFLIKAIWSAIMATALLFLSQGMLLSGTIRKVQSVNVIPTWGSLTQITDLTEAAAFVFGVLAVYYVIRAITGPWTKDELEEGSAWSPMHEALGTAEARGRTRGGTAAASTSDATINKIKVAVDTIQSLIKDVQAAKTVKRSQFLTAAVALIDLAEKTNNRNLENAAEAFLVAVEAVSPPAAPAVAGPNDKINDARPLRVALKAVKDEL